MRKKFLLIFVVASVSTFLTGCAEWQNSGAQQPPTSLMQEPQAPPPVEEPVVAQCEIDTTDYQLDTHMLGYEFVDEFNIKFGWNLVSGFFKMLEVEIPVKKMQLVMSMNMVKPMKPTEPVGAAVERAYDLSLLFKVKVDFGQIYLDPSFYYQTPLFDLTDKAMNTTLKEISKQAATKLSPWNTWVSKRPSLDEVVIDAGTLAGIQKGDAFKLYNVEHLWSGKPCESNYVMARKTTREPVAIGQVVQITENHALLRFMHPYDKQDIDLKVGAMAEVHALVTGTDEKPRPALKKNMRIGKFESEKLVIKDKGEVDLIPLMVEQLKPIILNNNYVLRTR